MKQTQFEWTLDGITFYGQDWEPDGSPRAVVALVHGLGEHSGRYAHVAEVLNQAGYVLMAFDLRGHGKSTGPRGHTPSLEALLDDVARFLQEVEQRFPGRPVVLYGHSLGASLALNYVLRRRPAVAGVIATGPALRSSLEQQKVKLLVARLLSSVLPNLTLHSGLSPDTLSRDARVVQAYRTDPLVHDLATLRMGVEGIAAGHWAIEHAAEWPGVPLLIGQGSTDVLGLPESSREFASQVPAKCTFKVWEGLQHEIHNEPQRAEVLQYMVDWLNGVLGGA